MIGPPGAGKGTQGALIAAHLHIPRIVVGDLLGDHVARRTDLGLAVHSHLGRGELVPDEIMLCIVGQALIAARAAGGEYEFDGVPRTNTSPRSCPCSKKQRRSLARFSTPSTAPKTIRICSRQAGRSPLPRHPAPCGRTGPSFGFGPGPPLR